MTPGAEVMGTILELTLDHRAFHTSVLNVCVPVDSKLQESCHGFCQGWGRSGLQAYKAREILWSGPANASGLS